MLHPKKGEGEHSKKYNKRRKAPQIALTVLIFSTPFCMAQSALATTSFGLSVSQQPPLQQQKVSKTQGYNYQLQNRQTRYSSLTPIISEADITALQTTLAQYKTKLAQLSNKDLLDPALKPQLDQAIQTISTQIADLEAKISTAKADLTTYNKAKQTLTKALADYSSAQQRTVDNKALFSTATATYQEKAQATLDAKALADASLTTLSLVKQDTLVKREALSSADASLTAQLEITNNALITLNNAKLLTAQATESLQTAQSNLVQAQQELDTASTNKAVAQQNYDTNLIPDPTWAPLTYQQEHVLSIINTREVEVRTLVPHTTYITTGGVKAEVFNRRGYNNAPPLPTDSEQPVYTTTVPEINFQWGGGQVLGSGYSEDVIVKFTGNLLFPQDGNYRFYTPADDGTKLNIAGMDLINDWRDKGGGGSTSQEVFIRGGVFYPFTLYYYENGGGANVWMYYYTPQTGYQIVPASYLGNNVEAITTYEEVITYTYENYYTYEIYYTTEEYPNQTAPLIKDPILLTELNNAITNYDLALSNKSQKQGLYNSAQEDLDTLQEKHNDAQTSYEEAVSEKESREAAKAGAGNNLSNAIEQEGLAETEHNSKTSALTSAQAEEALASQNLATEEANLQVAVEGESVALATKTQAEASLEKATSPLETNINSDIPFTDLETILDTPAPIPPKEEGSTEIPAVIENLMDVDLNAVDPTELTPEQATQLVEAALVAFETAEEGSPEYEQALDALYLAAEQDDLVLSEELAAIPGLAGAVEVLNFLGNAGADMSPKVREESEKVVVATVIAAGAAIQSAAAAASTASASSGGSRRIGK